MAIQTIDVTSGGDTYLTGMTKANSNDADLQAQINALSAGNVSWTYSAKTSDYTIVAATDTYGTQVFTNSGASGTVNFSLPAGANAMRVAFNVVAAQTLKVTANGSETIRFLGGQTAGGGYVQSAVVGAFWVMEWNGSEWVICYAVGNLTHAGGTFYGIQNAATELPKGYINGSTLSLGTDTDHDIDISAAVYRDAADTKDLTGPAYTKQIDAIFAEGDDAGGMATGSVANNTLYAFNLIEKDSDSSVDYCFDTSFAGANTPSGWTFRLCLGWVLTDGSANIVPFIMIGNGNTCYYAYQSSQTVATALSQTSFTAQSLAAVIPTASMSIAEVVLIIKPSAQLLATLSYDGTNNWWSENIDAAVDYKPVPIVPNGNNVYYKVDSGNINMYLNSAWFVR